MRIRELHILDNEQIIYSSIRTFKTIFLHLESENKHTYMQYRGTMKNCLDLNHMQEKTMQAFLERHEFKLDDDLQVFPINLN